MSLPLTAHAAIEIGGRRYDTLKNERLFFGLEIQLTVGMASEATWRVNDPEYVMLDRYTSDDGITQLDAIVWLWFGDQPGKPVFEGLLTSVERDEESSVSVFRFFDHGYPMRQVQQTEYHKELTDVEIIAKLARQHDLKFSGPNIKLEKHVSHIQKGETDWQHVEDCAERAGLVLYVRGRTLYAREAARFAAQPLLSLTNGKDFRMLPGTSLKFHLPENREGKPHEIEVRGRGRGGGRLVGRSRAQANRRGRRRIEIRRDPGTRSRKATDARAQARKEIAREHAFTGTLRLLPHFTGRRPDVRDTIELLEIGKLFSGKYLCGAVSHSFKPGELETTIQVYRDIKVR